MKINVHEKNKQLHAYCDVYIRNNSWKPYCTVSFNMGWWIQFTNLQPSHVKTHGFLELI